MLKNEHQYRDVQQEVKEGRIWDEHLAHKSEEKPRGSNVPQDDSSFQPTPCQDHPIAQLILSHKAISCSVIYSIYQQECHLSPANLRKIFHSCKDKKGLYSLYCT